jgi:hypothetical protein
MSEKGIIYLIQPAELVGTERYKIGCSSKTSLERCQNGYKKGSRFLNIMECSDPFGLEKRLKETFGRRFRLVAGKEYFEGDEEEIKREFYNVVCGSVVEEKEKEKEKKKRKPRKKVMEAVAKKCPHENMRPSQSSRWQYEDMFQFTVYVKNEEVDTFKMIYGNKRCGYKLVSRWSHPSYYKFYIDSLRNFTQEEADIVTQYHIDCVNDFIGTDFESDVLKRYELVKEEYRKNGVETDIGGMCICLDGIVFNIIVLKDGSVKYIQAFGKCCEFFWEDWRI